MYLRNSNLLWDRTTSVPLWCSSACNVLVLYNYYRSHAVGLHRHTVDVSAFSEAFFRACTEEGLREGWNVNSAPMPTYFMKSIIIIPIFLLPFLSSFPPFSCHRHGSLYFLIPIPLPGWLLLYPFADALPVCLVISPPETPPTFQLGYQLWTLFTFKACIYPQQGGVVIGIMGGYITTVPASHGKLIVCMALLQKGISLCHYDT